MCVLSHTHQAAQRSDPTLCSPAAAEFAFCVHIPDRRFATMDHYLNLSRMGQALLGVLLVQVKRVINSSLGNYMACNNERDT